MGSNGLLIGMTVVVAAVTAGALYVLTRPVSVKKSNKPSSSPVSKETMIKIFTKMTEMMHTVVLRLAEVEQQVRISAAQQGQQLTNEDMEQYLMASFRQAMCEVEQAVYKEFNTNEEEVQIATAYFQDDEDFILVLNKMKNLFRAVTGQGAESEPTMEVPDHITPEAVLAVYGESMEGLSSVIEAVHAELVAEGLAPASQEFQTKLQTLYVERFGVLRQEILDKHEMGEELLHASVLKYQNDEKFQAELMMLHSAHKARLEKLGFQ